MNRLSRGPRLILAGIAVAAVLVHFATASYRTARGRLEAKRDDIRRLSPGTAIFPEDLRTMFDSEMRTSMDGWDAYATDVYSQEPPLHLRHYALEPVPSLYASNEAIAAAWFDRDRRLVRISFFIVESGEF